MKAILLAGGMGTRLRPLTNHTPKPIVPIFNRPFLQCQIDLLKQVSEIDEVILSLNYQPQRVEERLGDGSALGIRIRYVVEPAPLGTAGAVKYAGGDLTDAVVVLNGDVLTQIDLAGVIRLHRARRARATIVLTPVDNPSEYGLVETDSEGNVRRFLEKPKADQITTSHINAGIYVLEPDTFDRIPADVAWSIERSYFPSLVERGETFVAYVYNSYWIDIGTPGKYTQVHRDIMDGRYVTAPFLNLPAPRIWVSPDARIDAGATVEGPCFIDEGARVKAGARIGPYSVIGRRTQVDEDASIDGAILWPNCRVGRGASLRDAILGRNCHVGHGVTVGAGAVLGDGTTLTDHTRA
ncbi:MAG: NDP-sugar synthase [Acidobacteria bacterium]|nr:NDP-sugar synthase [Acidobacteriota bacterium]